MKETPSSTKTNLSLAQLKDQNNKTRTKANTKSFGRQMVVNQASRMQSLPGK